MSIDSSNASARSSKTCPKCGVLYIGLDACVCTTLSTGEEWLGKLINSKYKIDSIIGRGSFSVVYRALDTMLNRYVAIKILRIERLEEQITLGRFNREAQSMASLNHPNIVTVYEYGFHEGKVPFIVMELVQGKTLYDTIANRGTLAWHQVAQVMAQCASALHCGHQAGIIHRDLGPRNIILSGDGGNLQVKILDYGFCKIIAGDEPDMAALTAKGIAVGTASYMSPEQCSGKPLDGRSDIYSLGCVAYEALSGAVPFKGSNFYDLVSQHCSKEPKPFDAELNVPPWINACVFKCLAKSPDDRFQTGEELCHAVERAAVPGAPATKTKHADAASSAVAGSGNNRGLLIAGILLAICTISCIAFFLLHGITKP